jgi:uncharacterized protein
MRIVLDTNVLISGVLSATGPPAWILEAALTGRLELALDSTIREEYETVLRRPEFGFSVSRLDALLATLDDLALWVAAPPLLSARLPDRDDEPFLAVAVATGSILVTGNAKHFPPRIRCGVEVLSPRELVDRLRQTS